MLLITCPVTRTDELVSDRRIRSVDNHATHIGMHVECPACGSVHVYRTGRRWEEARARAAAAAERDGATSPAVPTAHAARDRVPA